MKRTAYLFTGLLVLSGCIAATPEPQDNASEMTSSSSSSARAKAEGRLQRLELPGEWGRTGSAGGIVWFALPSVMPDVRDAGTDHDFFMVTALADARCSEAYAREQVRQNWGQDVPAQYAAKKLTVGAAQAGYTWDAFDGVTGGATEPDWHHWCVHDAEPGMDLDIAALRKDVPTRAFVEDTFIPLWLGPDVR